jgi:pimeloyl-ACP methyl ester carboxylesterase
MPTYENDGLSLHYEVHGEGKPVVMLHGAAVSFIANYGACGWIERVTGRGNQVVGLDARGHGTSAKVYDPKLYGTEALSSDVIALLDLLGIERASVVGYSIGSTIALHLLH